MKVQGRTITVHGWNGSWHTAEQKVLRITKTMIVVKWGAGEQRFNLKSGRLVGTCDWQTDMTNPRIDTSDIKALLEDLNSETELD